MRINSYAHVEESLIFENTDVGRRARIRRAIVDKNVQIPEGIEIGFDPEADRRRGLFVSEEDGLVVVPKGHRFK